MILFVTAAEAAHDSGAAPFPPFDTSHFPSQIFWLAVFFGFLYIVLSRIILPRLGGVLEHRESTIANDLDEAARMNDQAVEAQKTVEVSIAQAQAKARETAHKAQVKIDDQIASENAKIDAELDAKLSAAEARITELREDAMKNVEGIATEAAENILSRFGTSTGKTDLSKAVKSALSGN